MYKGKDSNFKIDKLERLNTLRTKSF